MRDGRMISTVVEDESRAPGHRVVAFGTSVFVTDQFIRRVRSGMNPPVAAHLGGQSNTGDGIVLTLPEIARANSGAGLNLLIPLVGWDSALLSDCEKRVKAKLFEAFFYTFAGYKIECVMQEVYGEEEMRRGLAIGIQPYTEYAVGSLTRPERRAYLTGTCRDDIQEGSALWPLFLHEPPKMFFTPGEQDVLKLAVIGRTDDEIADALSISSSSVHKRWHTILVRAADCDVAWLPHDSAAHPESPGRGRGIEKRRHLLRYLLHHPQELRPVARGR